MGKLAVLVSGTGSLLEAMVKRSGFSVDLVMAERPCRGLSIAKAAGVPTEFVDRKDYGYAPRTDWDRETFTADFVKTLRRYQIDLVAMAGFMTLFDKPMFEPDGGYPGKILNTHPALLPAFPGDNAVQDALDAGVKLTGCTVHIATLEMDAGPILAQRAVPVLPGDTEDVLHERIKVVERDLYPETIEAFMKGEL